MHPSLCETPPSLFHLLTQDNTLVAHALATLADSPNDAPCHGQAVVAILHAFAKTNGYIGRRVQEGYDAWDKAPSLTGRAWGHLLAAQNLVGNPAGVAAIARHLDIPFVQFFVTNPDPDVFGPHATVVFTLFGDNTFLTHRDGRIAVPDDWNDAVLGLEEASIDDLADDVANGAAVVLDHHGLDPVWACTTTDAEGATNGAEPWCHLSLAEEMLRIWHDHDDPPFDGQGEEWNNLESTPICDQLLDLFLAMGNAHSEIRFSLLSASNDGDAGINTDNLETEHFPEDLFLAVANATIAFGQLTGGQWEYNDGPTDRQSGYNFDAAVAHLSYGPEDWNAASAHARLRARDHLLEMARTDSRLEDLRTDILNTLIPSHKDIAA